VVPAKYPSWVTEVSDAFLARTFGRPTWERGVEYARAGRVGATTAGSGIGGSVLLGSVRGSQHRTYQTTIRFDPDTSTLTSTCSCPMRRSCKHAAAIIASLRQAAQRALVPAWQQALSIVTAHARTADHGTPLAIQVSRAPGSGVLLRPLMRGRSGRWVRTGITWDALLYPWGRDYHREQQRILSQIKRSHRQSEWTYGHADNLRLGDLRGDVWGLLRQAVDAGVPLVPADGTPPVRLLEGPAQVVSRVVATDDGLQLTTAVEVAGRAWPTTQGSLVGDPPHGVVLIGTHELLLTGFTEPLSPAQQALLVQHPRLPIPAADVGAFAVGFLPSLRRLVEVVTEPGVDLPEAEPPRITLAVTFEPAHLTTVRWGFRYRSGGTVLDVGLDAAEGDPPVRDAAAERTLLDRLPAGPWASVTDEAGRRTPLATSRLAGPSTAAFASQWLPDLQARDDIEVTVTGDPPAYRLSEAAPTITLAVDDAADGVTDWFNLDVTVAIDGEPIEFRELFTALALGESHLVLDSGTWFSLERPELAQLRVLIEEARLLQDQRKPGLRLRTEHAGLWEELLALGVVARESAAWRRAAGALLDGENLPVADLPTGLLAELRPYQEHGYRWLSLLWHTRLGGILADDMGLGKTLQALALIVAAKERGDLAQPVLVVAPTSVQGTWAAEAARFAPGLAVEVVTQTDRKRTESLAEIAARADLIVTSYTLVRLDAEAYAELGWSAVLLDEAQFVKNRQARVYQAVRRLRAPVRFAMTGTPLENNLMDLWSLLSITAPGLFPDPDSFGQLYRRPIEGGDAEALARLHRRIRPLMLRRTKDAVAAELPPKQEQVVPVTLAPAHRRLYDKHLAHERQKVLHLVDNLNRNRITILRSLTLLRQLSLAPSLVDPAHPAQSAKIDTLVDMLTELAAEGHRALVFSQFTTFLGMVRERLKAEKIGAVYLDGRTRDRAARIEAFRSGTDPVFLISLKAGGFGLTLIEADYVFLLDPWWNPAAEAQAIDRTHRIGQEKHVMVYRLVSADTIEEKVVALQERKRDLFSRVVGDGSDFAAPLSAEDIRGLLAP